MPMSEQRLDELARVFMRAALDVIDERDGDGACRIATTALPSDVAGRTASATAPAAAATTKSEAQR